MHQHDLIRAVARVWREGAGGTPETVVGTALLVSPRHVLTCAHVVAETLGREHGLLEAPAAPVLLDFPASAPGHSLRGRVVVWHPRVPSPGGVYDIAGLELEEALPDGAAAAPLVTPATLRDHPCRIFGFPAGRPDGSFAEGTLKDVLANGWMMIRGGADAREFARPGYSGGPIYTEAGVVGMLTEGDHSGRVREAVMIPTSVLLGAWPELYRLNATCPYKGLSSFREEDARFFRGREGAVHRIAEAVAAPPFFTVLAGASGSGKSSLVSAGLVPTLKSVRDDGAALLTPHAWAVASFAPGVAPFEGFVDALLDLWQPELRGTQRLAERARLSTGLREGSLALGAVAADVLRRRAGYGKLLLILDQAEELFTQRGALNGGAHDTPAKRLLEVLLSVLEHPELTGRVSLLIGIRTDFLDRLLEHPGVANLQNRHGVVHYLGAVDDLRDVIEGPLDEVGLGKLEHGLVERILNDVAREPNPLPLVEFTLTELWYAQRAGRLTHAAYNALGGAAQALTTYAQATYEALLPGEKEQVRDIFLQLMQPSEGYVATRRVATFWELGEDKRALVNTLADKRLIVTGRSPERPDTAEVVHEALFEHWPLLQAWVREGWLFRKWQEGLRASMREWLEHDRHPDYLLHGARLAKAEGYLEDEAAKLTEAERVYIDASLARRDAQTRAETERLRREARVQRRMSRVLGAGLAVALALASAVAWQWNRAERQATVTAALNDRLESVNTDLRTATRSAQENARNALANKLSAQGLLATQNPGLTNGDPRLGALLAAHAVLIEDNVQSRGNLLRVLQSEPAPPSAEEPDTLLSPDGKTLTVETPSEIVLWDTTTHEQVLSLPFDLRWRVATFVHSFAFSPDGRVLAVGSSDRHVRLWDTASGEVLSEPLVGHDFQVMALRFSPDGTLLLSTGMDGTLIVWDVLKRRSVGRLVRTEPATRSATAGGSNSLTFRPTTAVSPLLEQRDWLNSVAVSPDGAILALAVGDGAVQLFTLPALAPLGKVAEGGTTRSLTFSPDGATLAVGNRAGAVQLYDVDARVALASPLLGLGGAVRALTFSPDGGTLVAADASGTVMSWDSRTAEPLHEPLNLGAETVHGLSFVKSVLHVRGGEGKRAALWRAVVGEGNPVVQSSLRVTQNELGAVALWDVGGGRALQAPLAGSLDSFPVKILFAPGGERFVTLSNGKKARLWDAATRRPLAPPISDQEEIESAAFSPDGRTLATGSRDGRVVLRDAKTGTPRGKLPLDLPRAIGLAFQPDGERLAIGTEGGVVVWDIKAGKALEPEWDIPAPARQEIPSELLYTPDGRMLISDYAQYLYFWDSASLNMLGTRLAGPFGTYKVKRITVSPDSKMLAVTYERSQAVVWNLTTRELVTPPFTLTWGTAFSADNQLLVTGGSDGSITLWNRETGEPVGDPIPAHSDEIRDLAFSPDGQTLVSGALDSTLLFWQMDVTKWLANACARAGRNLSGGEWTRYVSVLHYRKTCPAYPVDPTAVETLISQAQESATQGNMELARTLSQRALNYALELNALELIGKVCSELAMIDLGGRRPLRCQEVASRQEGAARVVD